MKLPHVLPKMNLEQAGPMPPSHIRGWYKPNTISLLTSMTNVLFYLIFNLLFRSWGYEFSIRNVKIGQFSGLSYIHERKLTRLWQRKFLKFKGKQNRVDQRKETSK